MRIVMTILVMTLLCSSVGADCTPPELVWAEVQPQILYLHQGSDTVLVRVRAIDDESGVASIWPIYYGSTWPPVYGGSLQLVSGTPLDGIWECSMIFPSNAGLGRWCLFLSLYDGAFINRRYEADWMCEHFPQSSIWVETNTPVETMSWGSIKALYH